MTSWRDAQSRSRRGSMAASLAPAIALLAVAAGGGVVMMAVRPSRPGETGNRAEGETPAPRGQL